MVKGFNYLKNDMAKGLIRQLKTPDSLVGHVVFWLLYVMLYAGMYISEDLTFWCSTHIILMSFPIKILTSYFFMFWVLPRAMKKRGMKFFILCLVLSLPVAIFLDGYISQNYIYPITYSDFNAEEYWDVARVFKIFVRLYGVVFITVALRYIYLQFREQKRLQDMQNEHLAIEMKYLKNQINPHFLFNTLNSLYSLIINKKDQAGELVLRLSDMMRYMIYDASKPGIPIEKEIELLQNYILLEKTRFGNRVSVSFNILGETNSLKIPALICLPLVENSFKHGLSDGVDEVLISIDLSIKDSEVNLIVENTKPKLLNKEKQGGFGLQNLKRRLDLLFNEDYEFKIKEDLDSYLAILKFDTTKLIKYA